MEEKMIIILGIWAVIATAMCIIAYWDKKHIKESFDKYKDDIQKAEELKNSGRELLPVILNHKTYFIYKDSTMTEAINMINAGPGQVYYDRTTNSKYDSGFIKYYGASSLSGISDDLTLHFENGILKSIKN